jgi:prepilin-type N-terminal cleavage/methylation domain-containing protein
MNNKILKKNNGITLVELLAALSLVSVIGLIAYSVLFGGLTTYDRVIAKNELRDEGNYMMTSLFNQFYKLKTSDIKEKHLPDSGTSNYYLVKTDGKNIGIVNSKIIINNYPLSSTNDKVILTNDSKITELSPDLFEIKLALKYVNSNEKLELSSTLSILNDTRGE